MDSNMGGIKIGVHSIGQDSLFFIIEEGNANNGDLNEAKEMIRVAADCNASAIEFQLAIASDFYVQSDPGYQRYLKREFSIEQQRELIEFAHYKNLAFIAAPLSHKLVKDLKDLGCDGFTINSSDLNNPQILDAVAESMKPILISLPLATEVEIDWALERLKKGGAKDIVLLHGQHSMAGGEHGVAPEHTSLGFLKTLEKRGMPVGFVDHTATTWMTACAVSAGAVVVTKHLCLDQSLKGPDWFICLEPKEMKQCIAQARSAYKSMQTKEKVLAPGEDIDRSIMRRSIVAAKAIQAGEVLRFEHLAFKRPGKGIEPQRYTELLGKKTSRNLNPDEAFEFDYLK